MSNLTNTQREILEYLLQYREAHGRTPSGPEIAEHFGYSQPRTAYEHLRRIEKKGYLQITQPATRAPLNVRPTDRATRLFSPGLPLLGAIPAGPVTEVGEEAEEERVTSLGDLFPMMKAGDYLLRVDGDSMKGAGIREGTIALMRPGVEPSDGDICAVWVDGEGGTLKRVFREEDTVRLVPENEDYAPTQVPAEQVRIQGVLVATVDISTFRRL